MQKQHSSNFDGTDYTQSMKKIFQDSYQLPGLIKRLDFENRPKHKTDYPYDELFLWSLLLYSGFDNEAKLSNYFWSKSKFPLACCMVGIIIYNCLQNESFVPDDLKEKLKNKTE
jgi:hypothetical protein